MSVHCLMELLDRTDIGGLLRKRHFAIRSTSLAYWCIDFRAREFFRSKLGSARPHYGFSAKTVMVGFPPPISDAIWL